ncbi:Hypothetical predicted protein [Pelobates cultripes]|uniref:Uncharacterized protein n=1 Tax=Pelobates cultripes TaxID=61616 RepID=A0AAD1RED7_PELCU|nr:Hypothetical predicted protein [Pelobates cultripes]
MKAWKLWDEGNTGEPDNQANRPNTSGKVEPQAGTQLERKLERTDMTRRLAIEKTGSGEPTAEPRNGEGKRLDTLGVTISMVIACENSSRKASIFTPGGVHIAGTSTRR